MGLYWAWTFFSFNPPVSPTFPVSTLHVTSMAGASVAFLAIALRHRRVGSLCARRPLLLACGVIVALASPLYMLGCFPTWAMLAGAALSGGAVAVLVCANAEAFSRFTPGGLLAATALVFMLAYMVLIPLAGLARLGMRELSIALACTLPLGSAALLAAGCSKAMQDGLVDQGFSSMHETPFDDRRAMADVLAHDLAKLPWRTLLVIACMYFAIGSIRMYVEHVTGGLDMNTGCLGAGIALLGCALVASLFADRRGVASLGVFYKIAMPLVAMAYVVLLTAGESQPALLSVIAQMSCLVVECLCWVLIVDSSRVRGVSALLVIGMGRFTVQLGMSLGELVTAAFIDVIVPLGTFTVFLLVLSFVFLFSEGETTVHIAQDGAMPSEAAGESAPQEPGKQADSHEQDFPTRDDMHRDQAERLAAAWGLTQREKTVFMLWVTSHGLRSVCETLSLSESTVKTHLRHIYEKGGVHSRAELIKLLDDEAAQGGQGA